jgi:predicted esterase
VRPSVKALLGAALASLVGGAAPQSARGEPPPAAPERAGTQWFVSGPSRTPVLVYPPRDRGAPRPAMLHLHSYCWHPVDECPQMQPGASSTHWLLCPRATTRCANGGFSRAGGFSHGPGTAALVDETFATFAAAFPDDARGPAVLSGFSQGAYAAAKLAQSAAPGRFSHLLLIAANVSLDPEKLRRAGIRSVLLAAGESDGTRLAMAREAKRLEGQGYRAAFRSLGPIGHDFPPNMSDWVQGALAWFEAPAERAP